MLLTLRIQKLGILVFLIIWQILIVRKQTVTFKNCLWILLHTDEQSCVLFSTAARLMRRRSNRRGRNLSAFIRSQNKIQILKIQCTGNFDSYTNILIQNSKFKSALFCFCKLLQLLFCQSESKKNIASLAKYFSGLNNDFQYLFVNCQ